MIEYLFRHKLVRYAFIGGVSTLIHITIASLYLYFIYYSLLQSNISGFLVAYLFSYTIQSKFVFEEELTSSKAFKYFLVQIGALLMAIFFTNTINDYNSYIKTIVVALLLPLVTFFIHKFWTFK